MGQYAVGGQLDRKALAIAAAIAIGLPWSRGDGHFGRQARC